MGDVEETIELNMSSLSLAYQAYCQDIGIYIVILHFLEVEKLYRLNYQTEMFLFGISN